MTQPITDQERQRAVEALEALQEAARETLDALRGPVYNALRYGDREPDQARAPYEARNLIADLEGKEAGWLGGACMIDAAEAARTWLAADAEECAWCGEPADDGELGPVAYGPDSDMHRYCWSDADSSQEGANR